MATQTKKKSIKTGRHATTTLNDIATVAAKAKRQRQSEIDPQNLEAIKFLESLSNATPEQIQEQKETWAFLKKALDEDRLSPDRPFFSNEDAV